MNPGEKVGKRRLKTATGFTGTSMLALALLVSTAAAQTKPPEPEPFKAMQTPLQPGNAAAPPAKSLLTPSLLTPQAGVQNPPTGFTGAKMVMRQAVWQQYVKYLRDDVALGFGFFMITVDGEASAVKRCDGYACQISPITQAAALRDCQSQHNNRRCVVFAEGRDIKYAYQVVP
jgi:hypothetical protein